MGFVPKSGRLLPTRTTIVPGTLSPINRLNDLLVKARLIVFLSQPFLILFKKYHRNNSHYYYKFIYKLPASRLTINDKH